MLDTVRAICLSNKMRLLVLALALNLGAAQPLFASTRASAFHPTAATFSVEMRRGFNAATYATTESRHPEKWIANLERALRIGERNCTNSSAFILGAQFGFSYRVAEFERRDQSLFSEPLRGLVIYGTLARLKCEDRKRALGVTDANLVRVLRIPFSSFAAWKCSVVTSDDDTTVIDPRRWLLL